MAMSGNNKVSSLVAPESVATASQPNVRDLEEFPHLTKETLQTTVERPFKKFDVIKHGNPDSKLTDLNPFTVERDFKSLLGKKHTSKNRQAIDARPEHDRRCFYLQHNDLINECLASRMNDKSIVAVHM